MTTDVQGTSKSAVLSPCGAYRNQLWRGWGDGTGGIVNFVMLNPSTADASLDDPTIRKCIGFAKRWGRDGIRVVNLFALRSTDPRGLLAHPDPIGDNDVHITDVTSTDPTWSLRRSLTVVAWGAADGGALGKLVRSRVRRVGGDLAHLGIDTQCLGRSKNGSPRHPLMLGYDTPLEPWRYTP